MHTHTLKGAPRTPTKVNAAVLPWLREHGREDNYFLHIQYWDPHRSYAVDQKWIRSSATIRHRRGPDEKAIAQHQANYGPFLGERTLPLRRDGKDRSPRC